MPNSILDVLTKPALVPKQEAEEKPHWQTSRAGTAATCGPEDRSQEAHQGMGTEGEEANWEADLKISVIRLTSLVLGNPDRAFQ